MSRRLLASIVMLLMALSACSTVDEPRWATGAAPADVVAFDSPRVEFVVEPRPDIGSATFRGVVRGRTPRTVLADADGEVLEVFFARGDPVSEGSDVLVFLPAPTEAELIALDIARLELDLAVAAEAPAAEITAAEQAAEALEQQYRSRTRTITAPSSGVIGTTRQNIMYEVDETDVLFELSDPADKVVEVAMTIGDLDSVASGSTVTLAAAGAPTDTFSGVIRTVPPVDTSDSVDDGEAVVVTVELDDPDRVELNDRLEVSIPINAVPDSHWVPRAAIHRSAGASFFLAINADGRLFRVDADLGRSTISHVRVVSGLEVGMTLVGPS